MRLVLPLVRAVHLVLPLVCWGNALLLGIYSDLAAVLIMFLLFLIYCP